MEDKEIKKVTATFMIVVALLFDVIQALINLLPFAGQILSFFVSIFAFLTFYVWFKIHGTSFSKPTRALKFLGGFSIELIPVLNMLPAWTLAVVLIIGETKVKKIVGKVPGGEKLVKTIKHD